MAEPLLTDGLWNTIEPLLAGPVGPASPARCAADINQDGMVDALDVPLLIGILMAQ